ncbi:alpha-amylase family glycosyl hydrolase [Allohahella marinimesophila]|uniref:Alpha-amylase family glycosyl hydrolase n=1 Tax=Allohahella marinimesophila TaxID=1054972 RepID=A0ABP7PPK5_9GAMM
MLAVTLVACGGGTDIDGSGEGIGNRGEAELYSAYACDVERYASVRDLRMYQIVLEAFVDRDTTANYNVGLGSSEHRGDLQGVIESLDYIESLGVNAISLSPVFESIAMPGQSFFVDRRDATGYFASNYFTVDPNFGTPEQLRLLVDEAHARGLYVFLDGAFGHFKNNAAAYPSPEGLSVSTTGATEGEFSRRAVYPEDLAFFQSVASYWITEFGIDGWRLDRADQIPLGALGEIRQAVEIASDSVDYDFAGTQSNPLGFVVGDVYEANRESLSAALYGDIDQPGLCSAFDIPLRNALVQSFAIDESGLTIPTAENLRIGFGIENGSFQYPDFAVPTAFITNHERVRLGDLLQRGNIAEPVDPEYWQRIGAAYETLAANSGPSSLYYNEEIGAELDGFDTRVDCTNDGGIGLSAGTCDDFVSRTQARIDGVNIDLGIPQYEEEQALRTAVAELNTLRSQEPALYRGTATAMTVDETTSSTGRVFSVLKSDGTDRVAYLVNLSNTPRTVGFSAGALLTATPATLLRDLQSGAPESADANGNFNVSLDPYEGRFLKVDGL